MAKGLSPVQRTLRELRTQGRKAAIVEKWNSFGGKSHAGIRQDLFGIIDLIALDPERGVVGIQVCSGSSWAKHMDKLLVEHAQDTHDWLSTPGTSLELWGWRKIKVKRGGKAEVWSPRVENITLGEIGSWQNRK